MSALALAPDGAPVNRGTRPALSLLGNVGGESTLDDLVIGVWEGLAAHRAVACPWCGGELRPAYGAGARPTHGRCQRCEAALS